MSLVGFNFSPQSHANGVDFDLFELELDAAWSGAVTFVAKIASVTVNQHNRALIGNLEVDTVETLDSGQIAAFDAAAAAHSPAPVIDWQLGGPLPRAPDVGRVLFLSDVEREDAGVGTLCYFDGADWRRCSDDTVAATP